MRKDYWRSEVPLRLPITKGAKRKLAKLQGAYFPSFSQSSVVKILFGVFVRQHGVAVMPGKAPREDLYEASPGRDYVEIIDCSDSDLALIDASLKWLANGKQRVSRSRLMSSIVDSF